MAGVQVGHAGGCGDVDEGAVTVVAKQLRRQRLARLGHLVADVEVEIAVQIVVRPGRGLGRIRRLGQAGRVGRVDEASRAILQLVAQQRVAHPARLVQPGSPEQEEIETSIPVVVGLDDVEASELLVETPPLGDVFETPKTVVAESLQRSARVPRRRDEVQMAVAVEVIHDRAAREIEGVDAETRRHVSPCPSRVLEQRLGGQPISRWYAVGEFVGQHPGQIQ